MDKNSSTEANAPSQFEGTHWTNDQQIYDFITHKKISTGWDIADIRKSLISQGLDEEYADAIIQNYIEASQKIDPTTYGTGIIVGIISSLIIGAVGAGICILMEKILDWVVVIATFLIGLIVQRMSNKSGLITGIISAICGVVAVIVFAYLMDFKRYILEDGSRISDSLWFCMGVAALLSGYSGYKEHPRTEED